MVDVSKGIESLTSFKRDTERFRRQLKRHRRPMVLTVNGKAELIVQDAGSYQELLDRLEQAEIHEVLEKSLSELRAGKAQSARKVLTRLRRKHRIPNVATDEP